MDMLLEWGDPTGPQTEMNAGQNPGRSQDDPTPRCGSATTATGKRIATRSNNAPLHFQLRHGLMQPSTPEAANNTYHDKYSLTRHSDFRESAGLWAPKCEPRI
ncbi:hypothetical protein GCM10027176_86490 [Actinoallomurus bryophytorum]